MSIKFGINIFTYGSLVCDIGVLTLILKVSIRVRLYKLEEVVW